jgi:hypothetical protein
MQMFLLFLACTISSCFSEQTYSGASHEKYRPHSKIFLEKTQGEANPQRNATFAIALTTIFVILIPIILVYASRAHRLRKIQIENNQKPSHTPQIEENFCKLTRTTQNEYSNRINESQDNLNELIEIISELNVILEAQRSWYELHSRALEKTKIALISKK